MLSSCLSNCARADDASEGGFIRHPINIPAVEPITPEQDVRLLEAARSGSETEVISLLDEGHDINMIDNNRRTALMFAAIRGSFYIVMTLRKRGASTRMKDNLGYNAYGHAMYTGDFKGVTMPPHDKIVEYLEKFEGR